MQYRQGDVRDPAALREAFDGTDVVVHLAFVITGTGDADIIRAINVEGTLNTFRAAREAGVKRFVYASSVAAYGFHPDNPVGMTEDWPTRPADRLFYAQEKAELEDLLTGEAADPGGPELYLVRPPIVLGPHALGAKGSVPEPLAQIGSRTLGLVDRLPIPVPMLVANVQLQVIHEADVGQALLQCVLAAGPPGAYNIAGDGVLRGTDVVRELGLSPIPLPARVVHATARVAAAVPRPSFVPPGVNWIESLSHPAIMDTTKAKQQLGWKPRYTGLEALRDTVRARNAAD
jgi:nucleoside-diphosphate-sugar epimerase